MTKKKVFVSYDYDHDRQLKTTFISQAKLPDSPFSIQDFSLQERQPEADWISEAQRSISQCDIFILLLGPNTHNAPGVQKEIRIAKGLNKNRFQLRPQGATYGCIPDAGELVIWKWKNLKSKLS